MDKHSLEQQFHKSLPLLCEKTGALAIVEPGLTADWQAVRQTKML